MLLSFYNIFTATGRYFCDLISIRSHFIRTGILMHRYKFNKAAFFIICVNWLRNFMWYPDDFLALASTADIYDDSNYRNYNERTSSSYHQIYYWISRWWRCWALLNRWILTTVCFNLILAWRDGQILVCQRKCTPWADRPHYQKWFIGVINSKP